MPRKVGRKRRTRTAMTLADIRVEVHDWPERLKILNTQQGTSMVNYIGRTIAKDIRERLHQGLDAEFKPIKFKNTKNPPLNRSGTLLKSIKFQGDAIYARSARPIRQARSQQASRERHNADLEARAAAQPNTAMGRKFASNLRRRKLRVYKNPTGSSLAIAVSPRARSNMGLMMIHVAGEYGKRGQIGAKEKGSAGSIDLMGNETQWTKDRKKTLAVRWLRRQKDLLTVEEKRSFGLPGVKK